MVDRWWEHTEVWECVDDRTGVAYGNNVYFSLQQVEAHITEWQDRHDRGKRPDITRDMLLHMIPRQRLAARG